MKGICKNMTIGKKLTGGVILLLVLVSAGVGFVSYLQAYKAIHAQMETNALQIADNGAALIRRTLDHHLALISELAENTQVSSMKWKEQRPFISRALVRLGYPQIWIANLDGKAIQDNGTLADVRDRNYFKEALLGKNAISDVIIHKVLQIPVQVIAAPIKKQDRILGVIFAVLDATWLSETTDKIKYGEKGYSYIIDGKGVIIAHPNRNDVLAQRNIIEESKTNPDLALLGSMFIKMTQGKRDFDEYSFDGFERVFGYSPIPGTKWSIAVGAKKEDVFGQVTVMRFNIMVLALAFIFIGILFMALFARGIVRPILKISSLSEELEKKNLTIKLNVESNDEIGKMSLFFNNLIGAFRNLIATIQTMIETLNASLNDLAASSHEISSTAAQQAAAVKEIVSTMEDSNSLAQRSSKEIAEVAKIASETKNLVEKGVSVIDLTLNQMSEIRSKNSETILGIKSLGDKIDNIGEVVNIINGIADQTKIIAFNAALEAATAGEAGKNFQIVASEIRRLADNTVTSTKEIKTRIKEIQHSSNKLIISSEEGTNQIKEGWDLTHGLEKVFQEILSSSEISSRSAAKISSTTAQQTSAFEQILLTVKEISSGIEYFVSSTKQSTLVSDKLKTMAHELKNITEEYQVRAKE